MWNGKNACNMLINFKSKSQNWVSSIEFQPHLLNICTSGTLALRIQPPRCKEAQAVFERGPKRQVVHPANSFSRANCYTAILSRYDADKESHVRTSRPACLPTADHQVTSNIIWEEEMPTEPRPNPRST